MNFFAKLFTGLAIVYGSFFGSHAAVQSSNTFGATVAQLPTIVANYTDSLAIQENTGDTSFSLVSGADSLGRPLNGFYCFTVDPNTSIAEYECGTASGATVSTVIRGVDPVNPNATSTLLIFAHRRGAAVVISDYTPIASYGRMLSGQDTLPSGTVMQYNPNVTNAAIGAANNNLVDVNYVASTSFAGTVNGNYIQKGIFQEGTRSQIASGTTIGSTGANLLLGVGETATSSQASTTIVATRPDGTIDPTFISSSTTYSVGGLNSPSTTLTGVTTIAGQNVTSTSFSKFGGTGAQGALALSGTTTSTINLNSAAVVIENYTSISITGSSSLLFSNPATNGSIVILKSQGNCTLTSSAASGTIVVSNLGATSGNYGNSLSGGGPTSGYIIGGSFAQPGPSSLGFSTGFGGYGAHVAASSSFISSAFAGAGGGTATFNAGAGGQGGGGLVIECLGSLNFTGTINAQGNNGAVGSGSSPFNGSYCAAPGGGGNGDGGGPNCSNTGTGSPTTTNGGGGGGGGSTIMLYDGTLIANTGTINVGAGSGGTGTNQSGASGGAGYSFVGLNTEY